jgi:uroporphyrinogen decarboxylase
VTVLTREELPGQGRLWALLRGEVPDRIVCIPLDLGYRARFTGISLYDYYSNPRKNLWAQLITAEIHGYDFFPLYSPGYFGLCEFGGETRFPDLEGMQGPRAVRYPASTPREADALVVPDPECAGNIPLSLEFATLVSELNEPPVQIRLGTPFLVACNMVGLENLMRWMIEYPAIVHRLMRKATDLCLRVAELYLHRFDRKQLIAQDGCPYESNYLISRQQFQEFALPYVEELHRRVLDMGVPRWYTHICGDHSQQWDLWARLPYGGPDSPGIVSVGDEISISCAVELFGEQSIVMGNVSTIAMLVRPYEDVLELARQCIVSGKHSPRGYILAAACEVPPATPPANVHALVRAAELYGRY